LGKAVFYDVINSETFTVISGELFAYLLTYSMEQNIS